MHRRSILLALLSCSGLLAARARAQGSFDLLTDEEVAAFLAADPEPTTRSMNLIESAGPTIRVAAPTGFSLTSPVDFDILIEPKGGVPVSISTLRIDYRIGPIWKDVTARIARHGQISGTRLQSRGANLPSGRHTLRLSVSDAQARRTTAIVKFAVS